MSLLVVGSVALDTVRTPFGERQDALGGSATFASVAASFFTDVRLVGVIGDDFDPAHVELLRSHAIDLEGLERAPGRTFRWSGVYGHDLNERTTLDTQLNVFAAFDPRLPPRYAASEYVFLANVDPEVQLRVLEQIDRPRFVALDTMNFWIEGKPEPLRRILTRVDALLLNDSEARMLAGTGNLLRAAAAIRALGPQVLVIKRGEYGAVLFARDEVFSAPGFLLEEVFDPTGAGDTFAGGFMGYLAARGELSSAALRRAVIFGSALASFAVESFSVDRVHTLTHQEIAARFRAFQALTRFEDADLRGGE